MLCDVEMLLPFRERLIISIESYGFGFACTIGFIGSSPLATENSGQSCLRSSHKFVFLLVSVTQSKKRGWPFRTASFFIYGTTMPYKLPGVATLCFSESRNALMRLWAAWMACDCWRTTSATLAGNEVFNASA